MDHFHSRISYHTSCCATVVNINIGSLKFEQTTNALVLWRGHFAFHVLLDRRGFLPNAGVNLEQGQRQSEILSGSDWHADREII